MSASEHTSRSASPAAQVSHEDEIRKLRMQLQEAASLIDERDKALQHLRQETELARRQQQTALQDKEQEVLHFMTTLGEGGPQAQQSATTPVQAPSPAVLQTIEQWQQNSQPRRISQQGTQNRRGSPSYQQPGAHRQFGMPPPVSSTGFQQIQTHAPQWPPVPVASQPAQVDYQWSGGVPIQRDSVPSGRRQKSEIPLPRQMTFDGSSTWQSFILPFNSLALACGWSAEEKLFRLTSSLRGDAAEYAFEQLPGDIITNLSSLVDALDARFAEKRTPTSYLAQLEARKMQPKEKVAEYIADIKRLVIKGYPTADAGTRETIGLRHFLKGLPDGHTAVAVGMKNPQTLEEARTALDMYTSLKEETKSTRVRAVQPQTKNPAKDNGRMFVTEARLQEFGTELTGKFEELKTILLEKTKISRRDNMPSRSRSPSPKPRKRVTWEGIECYRCHKTGHIAKQCPEKMEASGSEAGSDVEASDSEN